MKYMEDIVHTHIYFWTICKSFTFTISQLSTAFKETKSSHCSKDFNCDLLAPTHGVRVPIEALNMPIGDSYRRKFRSQTSDNMDR